MTGGAQYDGFSNTLTSTAGSVNVGSGGLTVMTTANFTGSTLNGNVGANPDLTFPGNGPLVGFSLTTVIGWCSRGAVTPKVNTSGRPFGNIRVNKTANGITLATTT